MRLLSRRGSPAAPPAPPAFGGWMLHCFSDADDLAGLPYARLERIAANAASLLCAAVFADESALASALPLPGDAAAEAALVARRTADGFKAALEDRAHTVLTWPWEHLATRVTWAAVREGRAESAALGQRLLQVGGTYVVRHRDQAATVFNLWAEVAAGLPGSHERRADLPAMGRGMYEAYRATVGTMTAPARP